MDLKRGTDIVGATVLTIAAKPILLATAALVAICDGAPIFFKQERIGLDGKPFTIWKFRTMRSDAERKGPLLASGALSSHVSPLGNFLRRSHLDELPQLWNVIKGDMSLVGPRPTWAKEVEVLEKVIPNYHLRHQIKPGVTGWAQVQFRQTNTIADAVERHRLDTYYIQNRTLTMDILIVLLTIKKAVKDIFRGV